MNFREKLKSIGWSQAELAGRLGVLQSTVSAWANNPPAYAVAYVDLALELKAVRDTAAGALKRTPR